MFAALVLAALTLGPDVRMTVVGDSLALGVGASDSSRGFAFELFRRVRAERPRSEVTNLAIGGATAADVSRLEIPRIASTRPSVVLVEAGANDAVRRHTAADFARSYHTLVAGIERAAPQARIVLFNVPDVSVSPIFEGAAKAPLRRLALGYDAAIANEGRRIHAPVVDLFGFRRAPAKIRRATSAPICFTHRMKATPPSRTRPGTRCARCCPAVAPSVRRSCRCERRDPG